MSWTCPNCETLNNSESSHCEVCGEATGHLNFWNCPNCETKNSGQQKNCEVCGLAKKDLEHLKNYTLKTIDSKATSKTFLPASWKTPGPLKFKKKELVKNPALEKTKHTKDTAWTKFKNLPPKLKRKKIQGWLTVLGIGLWIWGPAGSFFWMALASLIFFVGYKIGLPWKFWLDKWLAMGSPPIDEFVEIEKEIVKLENGHNYAISTVVFNESGDQLISVDSRGNLMRWATNTGERKKAGTIYSGHFDKAFIGTNAAFIAEHNELKVIRPDGTLRVNIRLKSFNPDHYSIGSDDAMVMDEKGSYLALPGAPGKVNLINTNNFSNSVLDSSHNSKISALAFVPETALLLSGSVNGDFEVIDTIENTIVFNFNTGGKKIIDIACAAHSENETFAISYQGGNLRIFSGFRDSKPKEININDLEWGGNSHFDANRIAFIPGKQMLVTVNQVGIIQLWDLLPDKPILLQSFATENEDIRDLAISPDGKTIVAGNADGSLSNFNLKNIFSASDSNLKGTLMVESTIDESIVKSKDPVGEDSLIYGEMEEEEKKDVGLKE